MTVKHGSQITRLGPAFLLFLLFHSVGARTLRRDLTVPASSGWSYKGCWVDSVSARTLVGDYQHSDVNTIESCQSYCFGKGYKYAGVEYGYECFCSNAIRDGTAAQADGDCSMPCTGNSNEPCGGPGRMNLFESLEDPVTLTTAPGISNFNYLGCYTDSVYGRTLTQAVSVDGSMTPEKCMAACAVGGFKFAGVEYSTECFCGNFLKNGGHPAEDGEALCNMACKGAPTFKCGGPSRLNLYTDITKQTLQLPSGWSSDGCYTDSKDLRTLTHLAEIPDFREDLIIEACVAACSSQGYVLAGVEFGQECWCDNNYMNGGQVASDGGCTMPCTGDSSSFCGGADRLSVFGFENSGSGNLIKNPGFDESPYFKDWTLSQSNSYGGSSSASVVTQNCQSSSHCAELSVTGPGGNNYESNYMFVNQDVNTVPGTQYQISVAYQGITITGSCVLRISLEIGDVFLPVFTQTVIESDRFRTISQALPIYQSSIYVSVGFSCQGGTTSTLKIDDIGIFPTSNIPNAVGNPGFEEASASPWYFDADASTAPGEFSISQDAIFGVSSGLLVLDRDTTDKRVYLSQPVSGLEPGKLHLISFTMTAWVDSQVTSGVCFVSAGLWQGATFVPIPNDAGFTKDGVNQLFVANIFLPQVTSAKFSIQLWCSGNQAGKRYVRLDNFYLAKWILGTAP